MSNFTDTDSSDSFDFSLRKALNETNLRSEDYYPMTNKSSEMIPSVQEDSKSIPDVASTVERYIDNMLNENEFENMLKNGKKGRPFGRNEPKKRPQYNYFKKYGLNMFGGGEKTRSKYNNYNVKYDQNRINHVDRLYQNFGPNQNYMRTMNANYQPGRPYQNPGYNHNQNYGRNEYNQGRPYQKSGYNQHYGQYARNQGFGGMDQNRKPQYFYNPRYAPSPEEEIFRRTHTISQQKLTPKTLQLTPIPHYYSTRYTPNPEDELSRRTHTGTHRLLTPQYMDRLHQSFLSSSRRNKFNQNSASTSVASSFKQSEQSDENTSTHTISQQKLTPKILQLTPIPHYYSTRYTPNPEDELSRRTHRGTHRLLTPQYMDRLHQSFLSSSRRNKFNKNSASTSVASSFKQSEQSDENTSTLSRPVFFSEEQEPPDPPIPKPPKSYQHVGKHTSPPYKSFRTGQRETSKETQEYNNVYQMPKISAHDSENNSPKGVPM